MKNTIYTILIITALLVISLPVYTTLPIAVATYDMCDTYETYDEIMLGNYLADNLERFTIDDRYGKIISGDNSLTLSARITSISSSEVPILSHTWEYSYDGTFNDTVSETIMTDLSLDKWDRSSGKVTLTGLEAGHEYHIRMFATNASSNSDYSNVVIGIPGTGDYTFTMDSLTYVNGTNIQCGDIIQTNSTLLFSGTILKNDLSFENLDVFIGFDSINSHDKSTITYNMTTPYDGTWNGSIQLNLPLSWDRSIDHVDVSLSTYYLDEFNNIFLISGFLLINYQFIIVEGQCPEGYKAYIIDEEGNIECSVTPKWHISEMNRVNSEITRVNTEIERVNSELEYTNSEMDRVNSEIASVRVELDRVNSEIEHINSKMKDALDNRNVLNGTVNQQTQLDIIYTDIQLIYSEMTSAINDLGTSINSLHIIYAPAPTPEPPVIPTDTYPELKDDDIHCGLPVSQYNKVIIGTNGDDRITFRNTSENFTTTIGNDLIFARGGNDFVKAIGGNDCIFGGSGNDILFGSRGNDTIYGGDGDDRLEGNQDIDILDGGAGRDECRGESKVNCEY